MDDEGRLERVRRFINTGPGRVAVIVLAGVAVAIAIGRALGGKTATQRQAAAIRARGLNVLYYCRACKKTGKTHKAFDEPFPIVCPHCGRREAVAAFVCVGCKRIIEAKDAPIFRCRHCRYLYDQRLLAPGAQRPKPTPTPKR